MAHINSDILRLGVRFLILVFWGLLYVSEETAVCIIISWLRADFRKTFLAHPDCLYDS